LTPWFMDHVLRYTKQKPRNKSLLTAKGRRPDAQSAKIQGIWTMNHGLLTAEGRRPDAQMNIEPSAKVHDARTKETWNSRKALIWDK